jgi:hypothetical protein
MIYNKPEVSTLGDAKALIESMHAKPYQNFDNGVILNATAYDLDE